MLSLNKELTLKFININDIKGAYAVRNFIAHDYEGVDLAFIENILRFKIQELKKDILAFKEFLQEIKCN